MQRNSSLEAEMAFPRTFHCNSQFLLDHKAVNKLAGLSLNWKLKVENSSMNPYPIVKSIGLTAFNSGDIKRLNFSLPILVNIVAHTNTLTTKKTIIMNSIASFSVGIYQHSAYKFRQISFGIIWRWYSSKNSKTFTSENKPMNSDFCVFCAHSCTDCLNKLSPTLIHRLNIDVWPWENGNTQKTRYFVV